MARRMMSPERQPPCPRARARYGRSHAARPSPPTRGRTRKSRERGSANPITRNHAHGRTESSYSTPTASRSCPAPRTGHAVSSTPSASPNASTGRSPSSHPCNHAKSDSDLETFLEKNPNRSTAVRTRENLRPPLAAAGSMAWICQTLRSRLSARELKIRRTTGADTAHRRRELGITKNHANDAACCGSRRPVTQLRLPADLKAVGHGRRKQIKSLPVGKYLAWRHQPPAERRKTPCPGHARHPNTVYGVGSGDLVHIRRGKKWVKGRAQVTAGVKRVAVRVKQRSVSTSQKHHVRLIAPRNGYQESK